MYRKLFAAFAAVALLAACESSTESSDALKGAGSGARTGTTAAPGTAADFVVNVGDRVFFDFDKSDIKSDAQQVLDRQAAWLKQYASTKVVIEGHCDERGTREYTWRWVSVVRPLPKTTWSAKASMLSVCKPSA
ncbi:MAG: OmpA family protein, partial [Holosporaceae bacterium]